MRIRSLIIMRQRWNGKLQPDCVKTMAVSLLEPSTPPEAASHSKTIRAVHPQSGGSGNPQAPLLPPPEATPSVPRPTAITAPPSTALHVSRIFRCHMPSPSPACGRLSIKKTDRTFDRLAQSSHPTSNLIASQSIPPPPPISSPADSIR